MRARCETFKVAAPLIINNYQFVDLHRASLHVSEWSRRPADVRGKKIQMRRESEVDVPSHADRC